MILTNWRNTFCKFMWVDRHCGNKFDSMRNSFFKSCSLVYTSDHSFFKSIPGCQFKFIREVLPTHIKASFTFHKMAFHPVCVLATPKCEGLQVASKVLDVSPVFTYNISISFPYPKAL